MIMPIEIPAQSTVELKPGRMHIMRANLKHEFTTDDTVALVLIFQSGTTITMEVPAKGRNAGNMGFKLLLGWG